MCEVEKSKCTYTQQRKLEMYDMHVCKLSICVTVCVCVCVCVCAYNRIQSEPLLPIYGKLMFKKICLASAFTLLNSYINKCIWQIVMFDKGPAAVAYSVEVSYVVTALM